MDEFMAMYNGMPAWLQIAVLVIGMAKLITFWTPTKIDDEWFGKMTPLINGLLKGINIAGLNIFRDKNKDDKK
jgi:hypothetical protein